ncbi:MAG: helicase-exonuclease AddAB subunit AddA [Clostridia bacterium]|nr:helicase-exonuclease AddAB subunit AddA [Clostridia bacterium]
MNWTKEQQDAIYKKGSNILVAAAAGSGKTAVLVERIIEKILKDKIDIDKLLVVTFTNAAASEMRERVLDAIYKKLDEEPENENLQRQLILLGKANICTIHSFCLDVIRNNFYEIDLPSNFRIATEEEVSLLKQEVLEDLFESLYEEENENFSKLVDTYTSYRGDEKLKEIILKIYNFIQSFPFPAEWLEENIAKFEYKENIDFSKTDFGKILLGEIKEEIIDGINNLKVYRNKTEKHFELEKFTQVLNEDIEKLKEFEKAVDSSWDEAYEFYSMLKFTTWPRQKIDMSLKDEAKSVRDMVKENINGISKNILLYKSEEAFSDLYEMHSILVMLKEVIYNFSENYTAKKRERNIIDFNDIEHFALKILVQKEEDGSYTATEVAKKYQEKFEEIAIDEYQDSNQVQEFILSMISRSNNIFMVGDVKQSIYKFRGACPKLFLEKYNTYSLTGNELGLKIQLFKNFRSAENVLDFTNKVFESIMSESLGDINYTKEEFLNLGAEYEEKENGVGKTELHIIELDEEDDDDIFIDTEENEEENSSTETDNRVLEKQEIEAKFVANKIEEMIANKLVIKDKKEGYREITYKDIVILLRSTSNIAPIFEKELINREIPVYTDATSEYLDTIEIQTIMNLLKILDNPINDIALVSVLRSPIGGFTDNELVEIRLVNRDANFYKALIEAKNTASDELKIKITNFLNNIEEWREKSEYLNLAELIWKIYNDTGFYNYVSLMPNGSLRQANLKMLFERAKEYEKTSFKGLFNFIRFIEKIKLGSSDLSSAKIIGENENVVRIMSIHKSKGLEFPVVFLANVSKQINLQDLKENILLSENLGLGPEYINYDRGIKYSTSAKTAIKIDEKRESIAEEMRILYVALTRAKEKLIISSTTKKYLKNSEKKKDILEVYNSNEKAINPILLKKFTSYLDWLELVIYSKDMEDIITTYVHKKSELLEEKVIEEKEVTKFNFDKKIDIGKIENQLNFNYQYDFLTKLQTKSTVSKIKQMQAEDIYEDIGLASVEPKFMQETEKVTSSEKGTLMHLMLQKIDFRNDYNLEKLEDLRQELVAKKFISELQAKSVNLDKIQKFLNTDLAKQIKTAKQIEKEKAFCTKVLAKNIYEDAGESDEILVQGIMDLYFINSSDELILLDYKTDYVEFGNENQLKNKYQKQLEIYKKALEEALKRKVDKTYIYSLYLNKEILI